MSIQEAFSPGSEAPASRPAGLAWRPHLDRCSARGDRSAPGPGVGFVRPARSPECGAVLRVVDHARRLREGERSRESDRPRVHRPPERHDHRGEPDGSTVAVLLVRRHSGDRRAAGDGSAPCARDGVLARIAAHGPIDVLPDCGCAGRTVRRGEDDRRRRRRAAGGLRRSRVAAGTLTGSALREGVGNGGCAGSKIRNPKSVVWQAWTEPARREAFAKSAVQNALFLGKWLLLAFALESLMVAYVPSEL